MCGCRLLVRFMFTGFVGLIIVVWSFVTSWFLDCVFGCVGYAGACA